MSRYLKSSCLHAFWLNNFILRKKIFFMKENVVVMHDAILRSIFDRNMIRCFLMHFIYEMNMSILLLWLKYDINLFEKHALSIENWLYHILTELTTNHGYDRYLTRQICFLSRRQWHDYYPIEEYIALPAKCHVKNLWCMKVIKNPIWSANS